MWKTRKVYLNLALAVLLFTSAVLGIREGFRWKLEHQAYAAPDQGMVLVPAGDFYFGSDRSDAALDEPPLQKKFLPAFYMDIHEVTNAEFKAFDPNHTYREGEGEYPVTGIPLARARAYAASVGKRLPTAAEWEKAARGTDGRTYTWGNEFVEGKANIGGGDSLKPVGTHPDSVSPYGIHDLIGNAWEWVDDVYYDKSPFNFDAMDAPREVIKGGAYSYHAYQGRASYNGFESPGATCNDIGFRCVKDAVPKSN